MLCMKYVNIGVLTNYIKYNLYKTYVKRFILLLFCFQLTFLYPLYDRFQRMGGYKWRHLSIGSSLIGAISAMSVLFIGQPAFTLLEDIVVPFFLSITTVMEVSVFVFIYGAYYKVQYIFKAR